MSDRPCSFMFLGPILAWLLASFYIVVQLISLTDSPGKMKQMIQSAKPFPPLLVRITFFKFNIPL